MLYWTWLCHNQHAFTLIASPLCSLVINVVLYSQNSSVSWSFHSFCCRWPDRLCRPWLLPAKQLFLESSVPGLPWSPWPYPAQPATLCSAPSKALLWSDPIPDWEGKHSCHPRRALLREQVSLLFNERLSWVLRTAVKLFNQEKKWGYLESWGFFTSAHKILKRIANFKVSRAEDFGYQVIVVVWLVEVSQQQILLLLLTSRLLWRVSCLILVKSAGKLSMAGCRRIHSCCPQSPFCPVQLDWYLQCNEFSVCH